MAPYKVDVGGDEGGSGLQGGVNVSEDGQWSDDSC